MRFKLIIEWSGYTLGWNEIAKSFLFLANKVGFERMPFTEHTITINNNYQFGSKADGVLSIICNWWRHLARLCIGHDWWEYSEKVAGPYSLVAVCTGERRSGNANQSAKAAYKSPSLIIFYYFSAFIFIMSILSCFSRQLNYDWLQINT